MYITKSQLDERLTKTQILNEEKHAKDKVYTHTSVMEKELIGTLAHHDIQKNIAKEFGVTQAGVSDAKRGLTGNSFDPELKSKIDSNVSEKKEKIQEQVLSNLADALTNVSLKMASTDAAEASKIAVDMGKLLDRVNGNGDGGGKRVAIVINVPNQKNENAYTAIEV